MDQTASLDLVNLLSPGDSQTYTGKIKVKDPARAGSGRNQEVTAVGNRIVATPYKASFDNGLVMEVGENVRGTIEDDPRNHAGSVWQRRTYTVDICPPASVMPSSIAGLRPTEVPKSATDEATTQALANARRGMVSLPMLVKELPSSLKMIGGRTNQVLKAGETFADYWSRLLKSARNRTHRKKLIVDANAAYLEFLFGWKPFIEDTIALCEAVKKEKSLKIIGRGKSKRKEAVELPGAYAQQGNFRVYGDKGWSDIYVRGIHQRVSTLTFEHKVRASVRYEARSSWGADKARYGINWRDVAFDAVRLSFLLNFSMNIQDFLTAGAPMVDAKWVTGHVTNYSFATAKHTILSDLAIRSQVTSGRIFPIPGQGRYEFVEDKVEVNRNVLYYEPDPELVLRSVFDAKRAATLAAILVVTQHRRFDSAYQRLINQLN